MAKKSSSPIHLHFVSLLTLLVSIFLTGFLIKTVLFYFPFGYPELFKALHLSWNKVAYLLALAAVPPYMWFTWRFLYRHTQSTKLLSLLHVIFSDISFLALLFIIIRLDLKLFYFWTPDKLITYTHWKTHLLTAFFLFLTFCSYRLGAPISRFLSKNLKGVILGIMIAISLYLANFAIINDIHKYNTNALNLSVVIHPVIQVYYGKAVLIDQKTQYGLYAQILEPVFHLLGGISIFKFSLIMAFLIFLSMMSIGLFLLNSVHPILAFIGFCATIFFNYFAGTLWPHELYYQYYPIRTIIPTLTFILSWYYFHSPSLNKYIGMLIFLSIGVIWNLDVGVFALFAFVLSASYHTRFRHILTNFARAALVFGSVLGIFLFYLRLRYHVWPDPAEIISAQKLFLSGATLELNRLWTIIVLIYLAGLVYAAKNLVLRQTSIQSSMVLLTSILGLGIFTYSLNNPHDAVLTNCAYPAIIILVVLTHSALLEWGSLWKLRLSNFSHYKFALLTLIVLCLLGSSFFVNLGRSLLVRDVVIIQDLTHPRPGNLKAIWDTKGKLDTQVAYVTVSDLSLDPTLTPVWMKKANFAARYSLPNGAIRDDLLIMSNWDYLLYLKAHAKGPLISVNFRHLYLENEWQLLFDQINSRQNRYILVDNEWGLFQGKLKNHPNQYIAKIEELLKANYHPIATELVGDSWYVDRWYPSEIIMYERN